MKTNKIIFNGPLTIKNSKPTFETEKQTQQPKLAYFLHDVCIKYEVYGFVKDAAFILFVGSIGFGIISIIATNF